MTLDIPTLFDASHLVTFIGGAIVGAAGQYLGDRFTDQRRKQELTSEVTHKFNELKTDMPKLFEEISLDLDQDVSKSARSFAIVPSKGNTFLSDKHMFIYYIEDHPYIIAQAERLVLAGYLEETTTGNTPTYHLLENFVLLLRKDS